ncbi:cyclohexanecarboxylate-CoA ligase [Actinomadura sp. NBRC 104412]|uniref:AMP-binding protein n=1 Tax=Actinomadura sp. NBRC 104412 TaxID=3032203 RepID=UPI0024A0A3FA|nr:AMP-binding protein [Actinomadura sp. NBRC 104412]GLZ07511.1 cyclohexanecarboxylate-CoA ligase [Actinomadura sp. NBRC 104412]
MPDPGTLRTLLSESAARHPGRVAAIDTVAGEAVGGLTYAELDERAGRYAAGLADLGVGAGDTVAVLLPNGADYAALVFAIAELGAVYTGVPIAYGPAEIESILAGGRASVLVHADRFRRHDLRATVAAMRSRLPHLRSVVVADRTPIADLDRPRRPAPAVAPESIVHIGFTSGTTGAPKGVLNSHRTLRTVIREWVEHVGADVLGTPPVNLVASPMGHHTGFVWGALCTAYLGGTAVYLDHWRPDHAATAIARHGVTALFGAPVFLQDLLHAGAPKGLRAVVVAGAPVPRSLPALASERLGVQVLPAWGMTEYAIGISWTPRLSGGVPHSDGWPVPGCEVRIVRADGTPCVPGETGELHIRGAGLFAGYLDRPDAETFPDGWFRTGDTALWHQDGSISLQGRDKDIVIRGGENIPAVRVESALLDHPAVAEAAVIGVPHERLGEVACAVLVTEGPRPDLREIGEFLRSCGLSTHWLPERLEIVDALPRTPSGKIRKVELRERFGGARAGGERAGGERAGGERADAAAAD